MAACKKHCTVESSVTANTTPRNAALCCFDSSRQVLEDKVIQGDMRPYII